MAIATCRQQCRTTRNDDTVVTGLNQIAASADVPVAAPTNRASTPRSEAAVIASPDRKSKNLAADVILYSPFPDGLPGLSRAIRAWRRKPYDAQSEEWAVERYMKAFAVWDEACAVISARAPRVSDDDDPDSPYAPPIPDSGEIVPGDLGAAFALAVLGSFFHPSRERKRRTLLAMQLGGGSNV